LFDPAVGTAQICEPKSSVAISETAGLSRFQKIPEKIPKKSRSRSVAPAFKRVRDLDVFPGFLCTKDARVSLGCKAYHAGCI
jgi:hypothetical protein